MGLTSLILCACAIRTAPPASATVTAPTTPDLPTAAPATLPPYPPGEPLVKLAWFYKPPEAEQLPDLAAHFDVFILTHLDEPERDALRRLGVTAPFLQYLRFDAVHAPDSCDDQPRQNQVANRPGDFCMISAEHPDWFLLDSNGRRITSGTDDSYVLMDPGHPGWRAFWLERARLSQEEYGWEGVFLDNVEASLSKREQGSAMPAAYPDDASYLSAIEGFLSYLSSTYFRPNGRPLYANIVYLNDIAPYWRFLRHLDGVMDEGWGVGWTDEYRQPAIWDAELRRVEQTQALGKQVVLVAPGQYQDTARQQFAFASYLLIANGLASFRYASEGRYQEVWLYPNYDLDLGEPLGARYQWGDQWRRDFSNGVVTVDPVAHTATITTLDAISTSP